MLYIPRAMRTATRFRVITLKLFDTYGPSDFRPKLVTLLNNAAMNNQPLSMSPGEQLIDLVHIDDVIHAYLIAANSLLANEVSSHERYVVSSGHPITLKKLIQLYMTATGRNIQINWGARPYRFREVMNTWRDGLLINGWQPTITLNEGFKSLDS